MNIDLISFITVFSDYYNAFKKREISIFKEIFLDQM